jgi:hypothetical protein
MAKKKSKKRKTIVSVSMRKKDRKRLRKALKRFDVFGLL